MAVASARPMWEQDPGRLAHGASADIRHRQLAAQILATFALGRVDSLCDQALGLAVARVPEHDDRYLGQGARTRGVPELRMGEDLEDRFVEGAHREGEHEARGPIRGRRSAAELVGVKPAGARGLSRSASRRTGCGGRGSGHCFGLRGACCEGFHAPGECDFETRVSRDTPIMRKDRAPWALRGGSEGRSGECGDRPGGLDGPGARSWRYALGPSTRASVAS